jgi:Lsr2
MTQHASVIYLCDMPHEEETEAHDSVKFSLNGKDYEIDLCGEHSKPFTAVLAEHAEHGRPIRLRRRTPETQATSAEVRAWARHAGLPISERGRIPADVIRQHTARVAGAA